MIKNKLNYQPTSDQFWVSAAIILDNFMKTTIASMNLAGVYEWKRWLIFCLLPEKRRHV